MYLVRRVCWVGLILLAFSLAVIPCAASTVQVRFTTIKQYMSYKMTVLKDNRVVWSATGPEHWAMVLHDRDMILSGSGYGGRVRAYTYFGKKLWSMDTEFGPRELESYVGAEVSGNILMLWGRGPTFGVSISHVETFPATLERRRLNAYDVRTGRFLWRTNPLKVGHPIWMNGKVFISVAYDASEKAIRRYKKSGRRLPVFMEEWSLLPRRRLWRKRIPGDPPELASVRWAGRHSLRLSFKSSDVSWDEDGYLRSLSKFSIVVPLLRGGIPTKTQKPTLYEKDGIY